MNEFVGAVSIISAIFLVVLILLALMLTHGSKKAAASIVVSVILALGVVATLFEQVNSLAIFIAFAIVGVGVWLAARIVGKGVKA